jgi:hypothetical protein
MDVKIEKIRSDLEQIKHIISQYESISRIPKIEIDIVLSVIREIYSGLLETPDSKPAVSTQTDVPVSKPADLTTVKSADTVSEKESTERVEFMDDDHQAKPEKQERIVAGTAHPDKDASHTRKTEEKKKIKLETLSDKLQGDRQFVYETLAEKAARQNISTKLQSKPISSISSAIGINDKFKLIRDLFNEDSELYVRTIEKLDSCNDFNEAFNYINTSFNWDMEDDSVLFILDLVRRKFIVNNDE